MSRAITPSRLYNLWIRYAAFRQNQVAPSTSKRDYHKIQRRIEVMKKAAPTLGTALQMRDYLLDAYSSDIARRTLQQFNACCQWAVESELLKNNPFRGLVKHIRKTRPSPLAWAAFTTEERDTIINQFEQENPYYVPWVKFLFYTACRPEEASALRWEHVNRDCSEFVILEARPVDIGEVQSTKNYLSTRFPCNPRLQSLLQDLKRSASVEWVLPGRSGLPMNYHNFQTRHWRPLVKQLVQDGHVAIYLPQYHCRHTWITEALNHLPIKDVAYLARVSPDVLMKHYAGRSRKIEIPEF